MAQHTHLTLVTLGSMALVKVDANLLTAEAVLSHLGHLLPIVLIFGKLAHSALNFSLRTGALLHYKHLVLVVRMKRTNNT